MQTLKEENLYFFYQDCSNVQIIPGSVEHAYISILNDNLDSALEIFTKIDSPRGKWGTILVSILKGILVKFPTYFQIRNFYEIDLDFLIKNRKIEYVELLLGALDVLSTINYESYKYAARVLYVNSFYPSALKYMNKSKKCFYKDAELHFMLAKYYLKMNDYDNSKLYINECLKMIPDYYPAKLMLNKIEEMTF